MLVISSAELSSVKVVVVPATKVLLSVTNADSELSEDEVAVKVYVAKVALMVEVALMVMISPDSKSFKVAVPPRLRST